MTEAEWLACADPKALVRHHGRSASARKLRLFACACWRRRAEAIRPAPRKALLAAVGGVEAWLDGGPALAPAERRRWIVAGHAAYNTALATASALMSAAGCSRLGPTEAELCALFRDVFGNPFHAITVPAPWLAAADGAAAKVARGIYEDRAFDRLPILADALEEAGCTREAILSHCRGPGPHVRGCWVVDLVLGKE
jgi:hypothetical protein